MTPRVRATPACEGYSLACQHTEAWPEPLAFPHPRWEADWSGGGVSTLQRSGWKEGLYIGGTSYWVTCTKCCYPLVTQAPSQTGELST